MKHFKYTVDNDGIAFVTWDVENLPVNVMNTEVNLEFFEVAGKALEDENIKGIVINSAKKDFIVGGDLKWFLTMNVTREDFFEGVMKTNKFLRRLETSGKPVVAAINGLALGGGLEIALACHHRIMDNQPKSRVGLVECSVGLFPGAGGTQRYLRIMGPQKTIQYITQSTKLPAEKALKEGLVNEIAAPEELNEKAKQWILANPNPMQPWDDKHFKVPGTPNGIGQIPGVSEFYSVSNTMLYNKTHGNLPYFKNLMNAIFQGSGCHIDNALEVEARYFVDTVFNDVTKNIIRTGFFAINDANKGKAKPTGFEKKEFKKVGVLGAGMMGAGIAYVTVKAGIDVVLKDVTIEDAEKGKAYTQKIEGRKLAKGRTTQEAIDGLLSKIHTTEKVEDLKDCDIIIEAVFENEKLKNQVTKETEVVIKDNVVYGSNTSTIPITTLAKGSERPANFIGIHFFSPVDKMPLVEIIVGEKTSDETLAAVIDYVIKIRKTPIVVNDGRGFFTSRVFGQYTSEGVAMLSEGIPPAVIENVAKKIGMPVGPLAVSDEVTQQLMLDIMSENPNLSDFEKELQTTLKKIVNDYGRAGKKTGKGFYEYPKEGKKHLWKEWNTIFPVSKEFDEEEVGRRLLFAMTADTCRCLDEGVLQDPKDGDIGSILGLGFPIYTGGVLSYIDFIGGQEFLSYSKKLTTKHGKRFKLPESIEKRIVEAGNGRVFN